MDWMVLLNALLIFCLRLVDVSLGTITFDYDRTGPA